MIPPFPILYEDNHLLAINKPAGLATMGAARGETSVYELAGQYIKSKYQKPGEVYLGVVSRLDAFASGALLLARTSKAAARLTRMFAGREVEKTYWAVVEGRAPEEFACQDWLRKDDAQHRVVVCPPDAPGAKQAELRARALAHSPDATLLEVELLTGRKHQIRVQLAAAGHPIWGDRKYAARRMFESGIPLHARQLRLTHPVRREPLELVAPLPDSWRSFGPLVHGRA